jgi:hypothetical protein
MLLALSYMLPQTERPVRAMRSPVWWRQPAQGTMEEFMCPPELVWRAARRAALQSELRSWLGFS